MFLERIVGTHNLLATFVTLSMQLWNSTGTALERYEATKLLEVLWFFKRP
jgi:hypothetical protein